MKKKLYYLLTVLIAVSSLGCGKSESENTSNIITEEKSELKNTETLATESVEVEEVTTEKEATTVEEVIGITTTTIPSITQQSKIEEQTTTLKQVNSTQQITTMSSATTEKQNNNQKQTNTKTQSTTSDKATQLVTISPSTTIEQQTQATSISQTTTQKPTTIIVETPVEEETTTKHSPSENSVITFYCGGGSNGTYKTYSSFSNTVYNEYVIDNVIIETEDMTDTTFKITVTITVTMVSRTESSPNYIKGEWLFVKDGKYTRGGGTFSVSNISEGETRQVTFTKYSMEEGNYNLNFSSAQ